jgi:hypothetical protein
VSARHGILHHDVDAFDLQGLAGSEVAQSDGERIPRVQAQEGWGGGRPGHLVTVTG